MIERPRRTENQPLAQRELSKRFLLGTLGPVLCLLLAPFAFAQETAPNGGTPIKMIPLGDTLLSLPTSHIPGYG